MDLVGSAWHSSRLESGQTWQVRANYGRHGSFADFNDAPTIQPRVPFNGVDEHAPTYNRLVPIVWEEYVLSPAEVNVLGNVSVTQIPKMQPVVFTVPGTASVA